MEENVGTKRLAEAIRAFLSEKDIDDLGQEPWQLIVHFRLYYEVGQEFVNGAQSMREVVRNIERRSLGPKWPEGLPAGKDRTKDACDSVSEYFNGLCGSGHKSLFEAPRTKGMPIRNLSPFGWDAWRSVRKWLVSYGVIE
jgi:hypothetical protein